MASASENTTLAGAQKLYREGQLTDAIVAAMSLIDGPHAPTALRLQAMAHLRMNNLDDAENAVRKAIDIKFSHGGLHGTLGEILLKKGRLEEAEQSLSDASKYLPHEVRWKGLHALALSRMSRPDEASALLEEAMSTDPDHPMLKRIKATMVPKAP